MFSSSKLVNAVAQRLLDTIEQGRWVAGQMLPGQRELAEQMEISRPSLREAIMVLETLGVVRSLTGKGVMVLERSEPLREVAAPGEATMEDVLQLRYALEPFIVGIVAQSAGAAEISELRLLLLDLREAVEDGDPQALVEAYTAFHRRLVKLTSNPIFLSVSEQIGSPANNIFVPLCDRIVTSGADRNDVIHLHSSRYKQGKTLPKKYISFSE